MICAAFWNHTNIRNDNNVFACCRYKTPVAKFDGSVDKILHLEEYKKLREDSVNEINNPNCQKCYYEESLGKKSLRQKFNEEYSTDEVSLQFLEIGLDNICNLTCDGCWDEFSSSWAKKNNSATVIRSSADVKSLPATVNKVLFLGGEPLMTSRHIKLLKIANRKNLSVVYNTNGTFLLDNETIQLLKECLDVCFILSIDGYGELNNRVRTGSDWKSILEFIEQIKNLEFKLTIHTVIHKNNWQGLIELGEFITSNKLNWTTNVLTHPEHLDISTVENKNDIMDTINKSIVPNKQFILRHLNENINAQ